MAKKTRTAPPQFGGTDHYQGDDSVMSGVAFIAIGVVVFIAITTAAVIMGTAKIEADIETRAQSALTQSGYGGIAVEAEGTDVVLSGTFTDDQSQDGAFLVVVRVPGVTGVSGQLWATADVSGEEIVIIGNSIEIGWDASSVVVTGDISTAERQAFISDALVDAFGVVDAQGLVVLDDLADESEWIGTVLSLAISLREPMEAGRMIIVPSENLLVVTGNVEDKLVRNALNNEVSEAALAIGFDANPAVRVPEVDRAEAPTEEEVVALQIDLDALLKDKVVEFEIKSDVITETGIRLLEEILEILRLEPEIRIEIAGHADAQGSPGSNMILSQARADAVLVYLIAHDEAPDRYIAVGYGETQPIADNSTQEGRARNRRIEFRASLEEELGR